MKYCKNCLSTDLRPGGIFIDELCLPCYYHINQKDVNYKVKPKFSQENYIRTVIKKEEIEAVMTVLLVSVEEKIVL